MSRLVLILITVCMAPSLWAMDAVVDEMKVIQKNPTNYEMRGRALLAGNPCMAENRTVELTQAGNKIIAKIDDSKVAANKACTMEYNPIYSNVTLVLTLKPKETLKEYQLQHWKEPDATVTLDQLLTPPATRKQSQSR